MSDLNADNFWAILHSAPAQVPVFYRLYYDTTGLPIIYSMEDLPGNYIEVDCETYTLAPYNVRVVDNKLIYVKPVSLITKLQPTDTGTPCSPHDVCIVVNEVDPHVKWNRVTNETN